ncbi:MAG: efflux RND transporter periplasmic adaptor subunit [Candidatus Zixiibacteriota bacterium]|nr:MAG: efflux RND transporter periplasmic adaptor subunit [candidate division Zixibacteria bacterium]
MKKIWILILVIASLAIGIYVGRTIFGSSQTAGIQVEGIDSKQQYTCGMHPEIISDEPGYCPICEMKLTPIRKDNTSSEGDKGKIAYWVAPMDPTYIRNEPGKSPMGMDLVPVYENDIAGSVIRIDPITSQNMGIRMMSVEKRQLTRTLNTLAHITYDEKKLHSINSKVSGWIEKLYVDYEGKSVKAGEPLLEIYSPELVAAQREFISALKNYERMEDSSLESARKGADDLLKAARDRLLLWDISEKQIDDLRKTGTVGKTMILYSPADGYVITKSVIEGDKISPGMRLFQIADLSTIWAIANIYDYELPFISNGQKAKLSMPYLPGQEFIGKISYIYPYLNNKNRSVEVRIEIPNKNMTLKPNMYGAVSIESRLSGDRLVVPSQAVIRSGIRDVAFVSLGDGKFMPREVRLGAVGENDMVEIVSGLNEGDVVVTSSQFMLDSESRLREATGKIRAQMASVTRIKEVEDKDEPGHAEVEHPETEMKQEKMDREMMEHEQSEMEIDEGERVYTCPMDSHSHVVQYRPGKCPECGMKLVPADETSGRTVYECPMVEDSVVSAEPGRCPRCGMKLVEREIMNKEQMEQKLKKEAAESDSALSGVYTCPMDSHAHVVQHGPGKCPDCGMKLVPAEETSGRSYYTCPMESHSHIVLGEAGKCPECGMKLVKKKIEDKEK